MTADNSTNYTKECMPELTLSEALTLLKLSITGAFFPGYILGWDQLQDSWNLLFAQVCCLAAEILT